LDRSPEFPGCATFLTYLKLTLVRRRLLSKAIADIRTAALSCMTPTGEVRRCLFGEPPTKRERVALREAAHAGLFHARPADRHRHDRE
jgi:hypothetical protein